MYSVWERSDLSVYSVVKWGLGISRVERVEICRGFPTTFYKMWSMVGLVLLAMVKVLVS